MYRFIKILICIAMMFQTSSLLASTDEGGKGSSVRRVIDSKDMSPLDRKIEGIAKAAAKKCALEMERAIDKGIKSEKEIFSMLYFPIRPITSPPTFTTFYDDYTDEFITPIEDAFLKNDKNIMFVLLQDRNGYIPSHNTKYAQPLTGNPEIDIKNNRTKRIFNDLTGFSGAKNNKGTLLQVYCRDTGEVFADLSVPVFIKGKHWGGLRIGYYR